MDWLNSFSTVRPFSKWVSAKLSDICLDCIDKTTSVSGNITFIGWCGPSCIYASFRIDRMNLPNGKDITALLVAHEGNWVTEGGMCCHAHYKYYEDVQGDLGKGIVFRRKGFSVINHRSLFLFEIDKTCNEHILAVPATGEEIYFEIYGVDTDGNILLLVKREL